MNPASPTHNADAQPLETPVDRDADSASKPFMRVVKSYVLRAGRTGPGQ